MNAICLKGVIDGTVFIGYVRKSFRTELKKVNITGTFASLPFTNKYLR